MSKLAWAVICLLALSGGASAQFSLEGYFIALSDCQANKKKDSDNPGNVRLEVLHAYAMIARNATLGTHYQVKVPGAPVTESRWVPMTCGVYAPKSALVVAGGGGGAAGGGSGGLAADSIEFVLAASWQPAFCATSAGNGKAECESQTADRFDATHFSLHGLWPDNLDDKAIFPCYCERGAPVGCGGSQPRDTSISLSTSVMARLSIAMPGVQSGLQLHEWPKHGSCYEDDKTGPDAGADPDEYFTEAMAVLAALNDSDVVDLFAGNLGQVISREQIEAALDSAFGAGAAQRVIIRCSRVGGEDIISELWISLKGDISATSDLSSLILAAPTTAVSSNTQSCAGGKVKEVAAN